MAGSFDSFSFIILAFWILLYSLLGAGVCGAVYLLVRIIKKAWYKD